VYYHLSRLKNADFANKITEYFGVLKENPYICRKFEDERGRETFSKPRRQYALAFDQCCL
jgi:hypothetical protein